MEDDYERDDRRPSVRGYGVSPQPIYENVLSAEEKIRMREESATNAIATVEEANMNRSHNSSSAAQVKSAIYTDVAFPDDVIRGPLERSIDYFFQKSSRIPSYNKQSQDQTLRAWADISDTLDTDQLCGAVARTKLARAILKNELSVSRNDMRSTSESGISSIAVQSVKSDYKVSQTDNTPPKSIFDGWLRRKSE